MAGSQRSQSRTRTDDPTRSRSRGIMSLASLARSPANPRTESWVNSLDAELLHARLARGVHFAEPERSPSPPPPLSSSSSSHAGESHPPSSLRMRSASWGSSKSVPLIQQTRPPSLVSFFTEATPTETSIETGLANHLPGAVLLEENNDGVLELPRQHVPVPMYECVFWFLSCGYVSHNQDEWTTHCESHFRGNEPPASVQCPLCDWEMTLDDGRASWALKMQHLATQHTMLGQTLRTSRPDFHLFTFLWNHRVIRDADFKELIGGNHNLSQPPGNFVETNGRERRRERERRQRRQHVSSRRSSGPQPVAAA
ncbi:hypothetical protein ACEQ8H_008016 [Pleosporales sp. CAS-2024a]